MKNKINKIAISSMNFGGTLLTSNFNLYAGEGINTSVSKSLDLDQSGKLDHGILHPDGTVTNPNVSPNHYILEVEKSMEFQDATNSNEQSTISHDHKLPETGEQSSNLSIITFLASLTLIIGILLTFRRFIKPIK